MPKHSVSRILDRARAEQSGMTLIELVIGISIALVVTFASFAVPRAVCSCEMSFPLKISSPSGPWYSSCASRDCGAPNGPNA